MAKKGEKYFIYKVVVLGDQYCGKSSIISRYIAGKYNSTYTQTFGAEYQKRQIKVAENPIMLHIFDTMGQSNMKTITKSVYRNAQGIILVFDFSRKSTLHHIKDWIDLIEQTCEIQPELLLVGNKVDLSEEKKEVTRREAKSVAESHSINMIEVSAKNNVNVEIAFQSIAEQIFRCRKKLFPRDVTTSIKLHKPQKSESGCCH